jgi:hypothetical protein
VEFSIKNAKEADIDEPQRSKPTTTGEKTPKKGEEEVANGEAQKEKIIRKRTL